MTQPVKITPMLQQYLEIKEQHQDTILFYRMGDFYEMFFEDAITASKILGITLTSRSNKNDENRVPMCGVPHHAVSGYLNKMVGAGFRVAICEQTEDPNQSKGIVRREVVRIVTPGIITDDKILDEKNNLYVGSLVLKRDGSDTISVGLSFIDVSTGDFFVSEHKIIDKNFGPVFEEIYRIRPAELLFPETEKEEYKTVLTDLQTFLNPICLTHRSALSFDPDIAKTTLTEHFGTVNLAGFGCDSMHSGIQAAGALLNYIKETQKTDLSYIRQLRPVDQRNFLIIDESSRRNLELTETLVGGKRQGSLISILDMTCTPMGARHMKKCLLFPLQNRSDIIKRLNSVEILLADNRLRQDIRTFLDRIYDIERLCSRLSLERGNARDMNALKISLVQLPDLKTLISSTPASLLQSIGKDLDELVDLHDLIDSAIQDDPPVNLKDGNIIKKGFNPKLDELVELEKNGKNLILELEQCERQKSGIGKLKVGYNKIFGYFFEVSKTLASSLPDYFIRKQTLVNAERFITPELKELETKITSAWDNRLELEYSLFIEIRNKIGAQSERLLHTATQIAKIDFLASLAELANRNHYCKPVINKSNEIVIFEGRHPVIEKALDSGRFVPNDIQLDQKDNQLLIITGPNMAGKSTILRQTALIVLMAHIGSFVPADSAEICLVDRIFTRVGAMDDLRRGQSTFMVEMNETANILNNATEKSLVILDEIGRGTSTYDGLSIAWAVTEELSQKNNIGVKTLFATHYHELTDLAVANKKIQNYSVAVREWNDKIIFLHKLVKGATNRSYGIQVAALAGVPENVVNRAKEILKNIEQSEYNKNGQPVIGTTSEKNNSESQPVQMILFRPDDDPVHKLIKEIIPDSISPLEALQFIYKLHALVKNG